MVWFAVNVSAKIHLSSPSKALFMCSGDNNVKLIARGHLFAKPPNFLQYDQSLHYPLIQYFQRSE
jgi:hypothetical protein